VTARLVTITGVGGAGKTRLALEVAELELAGRDAGIYFVDLSAVATSAEVLAAVTGCLGLVPRTGQELSQVIDYLSDKNALVIIDNCEHVLEPCADLGRAFAASDGPARLVATSRELLDIEMERVVSVSGLPDSAAIELFAQRAASADTAFDLRACHDVVAELCRRLDGIPLAIELAAARLRIMTPQEVLSRLDDRFQLLGGRRRRGRTRTLEATIGWSYDLLDEPERRFFRHLAVFPASFDLDAASAVASVDEFIALELLDALVAKSLVVVDHSAAGTRYRLLETLRAYAQTKLIDAAEVAAARDRHLDHYVRRLRIDSTVLTDLQDVALRSRELDNVSAALDWAGGTERWQEAIRLTMGACEGWLFSALASVARPWIATVLPHLGPDDDFEAGFLRAFDALLATIADDWVAVLTICEQLQHHSEPEIAVYATAQLAFVHSTVGDLPSAWAVLSRAEELEHLKGPTGWGSAQIRWVKGSLHVIEGDFDAASRAYGSGGNLSAAFTAPNAISIGCFAMMEVIAGRIRIGMEVLDRYDWDLFALASAPVVRTAGLAGSGQVPAARKEALSFARRASLGRLRRQANDALVGLAAVAVADGEFETARQMLLDAAMPRNPHTLALSLHLADQLGIGEEMRRMIDQIRASGQRQDAREALLKWLERSDALAP